MLLKNSRQKNRYAPLFARYNTERKEKNKIFSRNTKESVPSKHKHCHCCSDMMHISVSLLTLYFVALGTKDSSLSLQVM